MDTINDALIEVVKALGGSKVVGPALWPEKAPEAAQRALLDALNEDRPQRLDPERVMLVLRMARAQGCHAGIEYLGRTLSFAWQPIEPKDEADDLKRQFIAATRDLS